jgi:hypothetical protein
MKEFLELRVLERRAQKVFLPTEGKHLGEFVRQLMLSTSDPKLLRVSEAQRLHRSRGEVFFSGWEFHRRYSAMELDAAEIFQLVITAVFEPSGEECGTVYDESGACKELFREHDHEFQGHKTHSTECCGAGAKQTSGLVLDLHKVPKKKDIARTIANEWIVSQRFAEILIDNGMTGFELRPARHKGYHREGPIDLKRYPSGRELLAKARASGFDTDSVEFDIWIARPEQSEPWERTVQEHISAKEKRERLRPRNLPKWYQLIIKSPPVPTSPPTRFGAEPFDEDPEGRFRCPKGHVAGLNLLSELTVARVGWDGSDLAATREMVGIRRGLLRPAPLLLISPRLWRLLRENNINGYKVEVAHLA